jgi:hypothetical protein
VSTKREEYTVPTVPIGSGIEKRQQRRFVIDAPLVVRSGGRIIDKLAQLRDLSIGGVFLYSSAALQPGLPIEVLLTLPKTIGLPDDREFRCRGTALRVEKTGATRYGIAAEILEYRPITTD